jgi:hypothetical protein
MKILLLILLIAPLSFSQWEIGASYKIKSDIPENGFGFYFSRNLPYQGATLGIEARAEVNLFRQTENLSVNEVKQNFLSEDYNLHVIANYFLRNFSPYFGFGLGYGELSVNQVKVKWQSFVLSLVSGCKFQVYDFINPYIEIQGFNYFANFDSRLWGRDISTFQFRGVIGVSLSFNTIK